MRRNLRVEEINTLSEFNEIKQLWEELAEKSRHVTIFQTWDWLWEWWKAYGSGRELFILLVWDREKIIGIAPLFISSLYAGLPVKIIGLMGLGPSDYLDFIYSPGREEQFLTSLFDYLFGTKQNWHLIDFQQIPLSSPALEFLRKQPLNKGIWIDTIVQDYCLKVNLPASWSDFKKNLSKKMRWNIEYSTRRINRTYNANMKDIDGRQSLEKSLNVFMSLHQKRWFRKYQPGLFIQPRFKKFHRAVSSTLYQDGQLVLYNLELNKKIAASLYGFKYKKIFYYYLGGFDPSLSRLSPGTVLVAHVIRELIKEEYEYFDFLRGAEAYKYRWGARPKENWRILIGNQGNKSALIARILKGEEGVIQAARRMGRSH